MSFFIGYITPLLIIFLQSLLVLIAVLLMAYFGIYADRKIWAAVQLRKGPNVVGPFGLLQSAADLLKLLFKEIIIPEKANKMIFILGPIVTCFVALSSWAVIPFAENWVVARYQCWNLIYFCCFISWSLWNNDGRLGLKFKISFYGGNEICSTNGFLRSIDWFCNYNCSFMCWFIKFIRHSYCSEKFMVYFSFISYVCNFFVSALAETNRPPFDLPEAEAELVAGYQTEYSSTLFMLYFLGELAATFLMCAMTTIYF